ncbi:hypothetical protein ACFLYA_02220 [Candidatus Dependentiae bacterium]
MQKTTKTMATFCTIFFKSCHKVCHPFNKMVDRLTDPKQDLVKKNN